MCCASGQRRSRQASKGSKKLLAVRKAIMTALTEHGVDHQVGQRRCALCRLKRPGKTTSSVASITASTTARMPSEMLGGAISRRPFVTIWFAPSSSMATNGLADRAVGGIALAATKKVDPYATNNGQFHAGHYQTNNTQMNNYQTRGNLNPYTGHYGTRSPRY